MKKHINKNEVSDCFNLVKVCVDSIRGLIVRQSPATKQIDTTLLFLKDGSMRVANLFRELRELGLELKSPGTQAALMKKLENLGYITRFKDGKDNMIMLTKKGEEKISEFDV